VRSIVKKHGGRIFAESKGEGLGSTFIVQLPKKVKSEK
jgi:signal transduction histidine kinase